MSTKLKDQYGLDIPEKIGQSIKKIDSTFDAKAFLQSCSEGYESLEFVQRGQHIGQVMAQYLPKDYPEAIDILIRSLGQPISIDGNWGLAPFFYLPHVCFVAEQGMDHFEESMKAQYELTQRFSAEFSIRHFLEKYPDATMERLQTWVTDSNAHVRRLVSEGTRPRLPWAKQLKNLIKDPSPILPLLEQLKDDPILYVRRSVANNLNDIGKDNPAILFQTLQQWKKQASKDRQWVIQHALRSSIKRGEAGAFEVLGIGPAKQIEVQGVQIQPNPASIGEHVEIQFTLENQSSEAQQLLVDLMVDFVKANGQSKAKTFKLKTLVFPPQQQACFSKKIALKQLTTRKHYPGTHHVHVSINNVQQPIGHFELKESL